MVLYRRNRVAGASYFFTLTLRDRCSSLLVREVDALRNAFALIMAQRPFTIDAVVILPEHLHAIWTLPEGDDNYPERWRAIKANFTRQLRTRCSEPISSPWQPRYWEHTLTNEADFQRHVDYIHFNPVKHGHVAKASDWPYSSFHRYVAAGICPATWGATECAGEYGEPL